MRGALPGRLAGLPPRRELRGGQGIARRAKKPLDHSGRKIGLWSARAEVPRSGPKERSQINDLRLASPTGFEPVLPT